MTLRKSKAKRPRIVDGTESSSQGGTSGQDNMTKIMDLPKELLVEIISYTLVSSKPITLRQPQTNRWVAELANLREGSPLPQAAGLSENGPRRRRTRKSPLLRVLLVCKEFYFAGTEAFYGKNVLQFDDVEHFLEFKARLGKRQRACVSNLVINALWSVDASTLMLRPHVPPLKRVPTLRITGVDPLGGCPNLQTVTVASKLDRTCYWFVAASKARKAEAEVREKVLNAWQSNSEAVRFTFPADWGVVKDK